MSAPAPDIIGDALLRAFAERGMTATLPQPDTLRLTLPDGTATTRDITEWRRHAGRNSRADLPGIAAQYAEQTATMFARSATHSDTRNLLDGERLRLRLYPDEALTPEMRSALVTRPLAPGLLETVVVDYPDALMPLNRGELNGVTEEAAFGAALEASLGREEHYSRTDDIQGVPVMHIGGTHRYVGSHVHVLSRYVDPAAARYGALVAFPIPEYVVVHVIGPVHLFAAFETVQELVERHFQAGEKALTPRLYWWRPGPYERLPERQALHGGQVPDLVPVGLKVDHQEKSIQPTTAETDQLIELWLRDNPM
ncbi:hypothetical protein ACSNOI_29655 [Actinomadura kijaniata]|uniref:hypothetical protein n=1 Tax=Actinomadura kijaniata TaxID=46161 RepID=UPI003F1D557F